MQILAAWHQLARGRGSQFANGTLGPEMSCSWLCGGLVSKEGGHASISAGIKHIATNKTARRGTTARVEASTAEGLKAQHFGSELRQPARAWRAADGETREVDDRNVWPWDAWRREH